MAPSLAQVHTSGHARAPGALAAVKSTTRQRPNFMVGAWLSKLHWYDASSRLTRLAEIGQSRDPQPSLNVDLLHNYSNARRNFKALQLQVEPAAHELWYLSL